MFLLFFLFPIAELYTFILFVEKYSFIDALLALLTSAALGIFLIQIQGRSSLASLQKDFAQNPQNLTDSLLIKGLGLLSGVMFIIPGFISDIIGLLFLLPGTRHLIAWMIKRYLKNKQGLGNFRVFTQGGNPFGDRFGNGQNNSGFKYYSSTDFSKTENDEERAQKARDVTIDAQFVEVSSTKIENKKDQD